MRWVKKGLIYCPDHLNKWAISHAAMPTPYLVDETTLRIYCAFRAEKNVSRIGYVDVRADDPGRVLGVSEEPVLDIGQPGTFDDNGVMPVSLVAHANALYLFYGGFELGINVPYKLFGGLAISRDAGHSFKRYRQTPIVERSNSEFLFRTACYAVKEENVWKMWYIAGSSWAEYQHKKLPRYVIKYLESPDGTTWGEEGLTCLTPQHDEFAFGRPYVVKSAAGYRMHYSIRSFSKPYRLGYAESPDGKQWIRKDNDIGLDMTPGGPDCDMLCYSAPFTYRDKTYLFYNGNDYGGTGILYAELA